MAGSLHCRFVGANLARLARVLPMPGATGWVALCPTHPSRRSHLRREQRKALVGVENPALDIVHDLRFAPERVHRAAEADPIEELLLAGILDLLGGELPPAAQ